MKAFLIRHRKLAIALLLIVGLLAIKFLSGPRYSEPVIEVPTKDRTPIEKTAEIITYSAWSPDENRAVLAQIESDNEVEISSELNGTLSSIEVSIGDRVQEGQILARFKVSNDPTQINYVNALSNLTAAEATTQSNIQSAEIALRNAEAEMARTISQQGQSINQSIISLRTQAKTAETTISNALTFLDRQLGASPAYVGESVFGRLHIGSRNFLLRNRTESIIRDLVREFVFLQRETVTDDEQLVKAYAQERIAFAEKIKIQLNNYNLLIRDTIISAAFTNENQSTIQSQLDALRAPIDNLIINLTNLEQSTDGTSEGNKTAILSAENRVSSAKEQLEISRAQAKAQMISAQAQVNSAAASQTDLIVRAPISGKIVEKQVNRGAQVSIGTPLFSIVNDRASKKVVAFLSQEELLKAQNANGLTIEVNGITVTTQQSFLSARVDPSTQKIRTEFLLPAEVEALVGSFVSLLIPLQSVGQNLLPISAIAFEPDGAEVLILDNQNIAQRKKITVGDIIADSVQINGGLNTNDKVVKYRNRVFSGEKVIEIK